MVAGSIAAAIVMPVVLLVLIVILYVQINKCQKKQQQLHNLLSRKGNGQAVLPGLKLRCNTRDENFSVMLKDLSYLRHSEREEVSNSNKNKNKENEYNWLELTHISNKQTEDSLHDDELYQTHQKLKFNDEIQEEERQELRQNFNKEFEINQQAALKSNSTQDNIIKCDEYKSSLSSNNSNKAKSSLSVVKVADLNQSDEFNNEIEEKAQVQNQRFVALKQKVIDPTTDLIIEDDGLIIKDSSSHNQKINVSKKGNKSQSNTNIKVPKEVLTDVHNVSQWNELEISMQGKASGYESKPNYQTRNSQHRNQIPNTYLGMRTSMLGPKKNQQNLEQTSNLGVSHGYYHQSLQGFNQTDTLACLQNNLNLATAQVRPAAKPFTDSKNENYLYQYEGGGASFKVLDFDLESGRGILDISIIKNYHH